MVSRLRAFEEDLSNNLYQLWNRMASGSYFPSPVKRVDIPKAMEALGIGIPQLETVGQWVAKLLERL